jgi:hypothetical protein
VKHIARLVLFFSLSFVLTLLAAAAAGYLQAHIDAARMIPAGAFRPLTELFRAVHGAASCAFYTAVLLTTSYAARRDVPRTLGMACVFVLALGFTCAAALGLRQAERMGIPPAAAALPTLGNPGLILSRRDTSIVLLGAPGDTQESRVAALPGLPLVYQEIPPGPSGRFPELPPVFFENRANPFLKDLFIDFSLSAGQFETRLNQGFVPFALYIASLCLFLVSLRGLLDLSDWPLANLLLGALAFRGVLIFETFLNTPETQEFIGLFLGKSLPPVFISPAILSVLGVLILLYTVFAFFARERKKSDG